MKCIKELYAYREMIRMLIRRDLRGRYKGTFLGFVWTFLNPLLQFVVYAVVFSQIIKMNIEQFYIYLFIGFIPWYFFASTVPVGAGCVHAQSNLVLKIYFPRMVLPISATLSGFCNMLYSELVVLAVILVSGFGVSYHIAALPVVFLGQLLIVLGIVLIVSAITVYYRDIQHIIDIIVMAWFYITPIVYTPEYVPDRFKWILDINPMAGIIEAYHQILYYKTWPDFRAAAVFLVEGTILTLVGGMIFTRLQKGFAEEL